MNAAANNTTPAIEVTHLRKVYGSGRTEVVAIRDATLNIARGEIVGMLGPSGSGKSTLMQDILAPALLRQFGKATETPGLHDRLMGADHLTDVVFVDQSPIGKTARSNPASYVGAWDAVRELFAQAL